jgi:hypothetical protein
MLPPTQPTEAPEAPDPSASQRDRTGAEARVESDSFQRAYVEKHGAGENAATRSGRAWAALSCSRPPPEAS